MKRFFCIVFLLVIVPVIATGATKNKSSQTDEIVQGDFFSSGLFQSMDIHMKSSFACLPLQNEGRMSENGVAQVVGKLTEPVNVIGAVNNAVMAVGAAGGEVTGDDRNELGGCIYSGFGEPIYQGIVRSDNLPETQPTIVTETKEGGATKTEIYGNYVQKIKGSDK